MESLLGRIAVAMGISLVLTLLLLVLYQDDSRQMDPAAVTITQMAGAPEHGTP